VKKENPTPEKGIRHEKEEEFPLIIFLLYQNCEINILISVTLFAVF